MVLCAYTHTHTQPAGRTVVALFIVKLITMSWFVELIVLISGLARDNGRLLNMN